jgi:hypothetical protein
MSVKELCTEAENRWVTYKSRSNGLIEPLTEVKSAVKVATLFLGIVECPLDRGILGGRKFTQKVVHEVKRFKNSLIKRALLLQPVLQYPEIDGL